MYDFLTKNTEILQCGSQEIPYIIVTALPLFITIQNWHTTRK